MSATALKFSALTVWFWTPMRADMREPFIDALARHAFRPPLPEQSMSRGWTAIDDGSAPPSSDLVGFDPWMAFALRQDTKKVPKALLALELERQARAWAADHNREKCPASVRSSLSAEIERDLLSRTPPTPAAIPVIWNVATGLVFVGSAKPVDIDLVAKELAQLRPEAELDRRTLLDWVHASSPIACDGLAGEDPPAKGERWQLDHAAGGEFLRWLWFRHEAAVDKLAEVRTDYGDGDCSVRQWCVEKGITVNGDDGKPRMVLHHSEAASDPALRVALVEGSAIAAATVAIHSNEHWSADLKFAVKERHLLVAGLSLAKGHPGDLQERIIQVAMDVADAHAAAVELLVHFGEVRGDPDRKAQLEGTINRWLNSSLAEWADGHSIARSGA